MTLHACVTFIDHILLVFLLNNQIYVESILRKLTFDVSLGQGSKFYLQLLSRSLMKTRSSLIDLFNYLNKYGLQQNILPTCYTVNMLILRGFPVLSTKSKFIVWRVKVWSSQYVSDQSCVNVTLFFAKCTYIHFTTLCCILLSPEKVISKVSSAPPEYVGCTVFVW